MLLERTKDDYDKNLRLGLINRSRQERIRNPKALHFQILLPDLRLGIKFLNGSGKGKVGLAHQINTMGEGHGYFEVMLHKQDGMESLFQAPGFFAGSLIFMCLL